MWREVAGFYGDGWTVRWEKAVDFEDEHGQ
jgi:hypothetical protein